MLPARLPIRIRTLPFQSKRAVHLGETVAKSLIMDSFDVSKMLAERANQNSGNVVIRSFPPLPTVVCFLSKSRSRKRTNAISQIPEPYSRL